jgi:hypothetical protein
MARPGRREEERRNGDGQGSDDMQRLHRTEIRLELEMVQPLLSDEITLLAKR